MRYFLCRRGIGGFRSDILNPEETKQELEFVEALRNCLMWNTDSQILSLIELTLFTTGTFI